MRAADVMYRRFVLLFAFAAALGLAAPITGQLPVAEAGSSKSKSSSKSKRSKKRSRKRRRGKPPGYTVSASKLRSEPLKRPSGDIEFVTRHFKGETYKVNIYRPDGSFDDAVLAKLDHGFRCKRTGSVRAVDPRLYEMMSRIYDHFGKPIELVSGHRYQRNEKSRHFHASAMDISIPGVSDRKLRNFAWTLDAGGMGVGYYPRSGFVHVDFRAPGTPSYRWTDYSGGKKKKKKKRKRPTRKRKPVS